MKLEKVRATIECTEKYTIQYEIAGGMNAYAFKATHNHLKREVFLKVYDYIDSELTIMREPKMLSEVSTSAKTSEYIVKIFDVDIFNNEYVALAMELIAGPSILEYIEDTHLGLMDAIDISKKILSGLSHLHENRIIHRDLKPGNIMLLNDDSRDFIPKISDFGSATRIETKNDFASASQHSALYVPPESWTDNKYGIASDLYQIGIILFEMINGCLPYVDEAYLDATGKRELKDSQLKSLNDLDDCSRTTLINACLQRRSSTKKILSMINHKPYYNGRIKKIVNKATSPQITDRYNSISAFLADLSEISVPNWIAVAQDTFFAKDWKGLDWVVEPEKNTFCAKYCRTGEKNFRRKFYGQLKTLFSKINKN